jgi:hypothetical protein
MATLRDNISFLAARRGSRRQRANVFVRHALPELPESRLQYDTRMRKNLAITVPRGEGPMSCGQAFQVYGAPGQCVSAQVRSRARTRYLPSGPIISLAEHHQLLFSIRSLQKHIVSSSSSAPHWSYKLVCRYSLTEQFRATIHAHGPLPTPSK